MNRYIRMVFLSVVTLMMAVDVSANDAIYYASGNTLVPVKETDISVAKEVLTITMGKDGYASVDVYYEFWNNGADKTVTMAFEAQPPYNTCEEKIDVQGGHPYIYDFTVKMNDEWLKSSNGIVCVNWEAGTPFTDLKPLNLKDWMTFDKVPEGKDIEMGCLYNAKTDSIINFAYAYYFDAHFKSGKNIVRHTYRYHMGESVAAKYELYYWLTPAVRWANGRIDDFTLRLRIEGNEPVVIDNKTFGDTPFHFVGGEGYLFNFNGEYTNDLLMAWAPEDAVLEWKAKNFKPEDELSVTTSERYTDPKPYGVPCQDVVTNNAGKVLGAYVGEWKNSYLMYAQDFQYIPKNGHQKTELCASEGKGWLTVLEDVDAESTEIKMYAKPMLDSSVMCTIKNVKGQMPEEFPCLGYDEGEDGNGNYVGWYKTKYKGRYGYVHLDDVTWSAMKKF